MEIIKKQLAEARDLLDTFLSNEMIIRHIKSAGDLMFQTVSQGNKIIACGNGGSMSDAMHFAEEMTGRFRNDREALPAVAISDPAHITCVANDYGFQFIFSRYIDALGKDGDVLLAISTSGNSKNIIEAAKAAREKGMKIIALTGKDGGKLSGYSDIEIRAPQSLFSDRTQEIHIKVIHILIDYIERHL